MLWAEDAVDLSQSSGGRVEAQRIDSSGAVGDEDVVAAGRDFEIGGWNGGVQRDDRGTDGGERSSGADLEDIGFSGKSVGAEQPFAGWIHTENRRLDAAGNGRAVVGEGEGSGGADGEDVDATGSAAHIQIGVVGRDGQRCRFEADRPGPSRSGAEGAVGDGEAGDGQRAGAEVSGEEVIAGGGTTTAASSTTAGERGKEFSTAGQTAE